AAVDSVAEVGVHALDRLRAPGEDLADRAVLLDALDGRLTHPQAVAERLVLGCTQVAQLAGIGLVQGAQVRVENVDELAQLLWRLAADLFGGVVAEGVGVLAPQLLEDL